VCFDTLPESEEALVSRIRAAGVVINIRASTKFTASVFAACPDLKLLSIWGQGPTTSISPPQSNTALW
jgi:phosphoglycerate dehydrogenase-like enzyme